MHIKTFGSVDQRSLDQLKRCMDAGDAASGVPCAEHHPGGREVYDPYKE